MHDKIALFDFCETLTDFQTADAYVDFVRERIGDSRSFRWERFRNLLVKTKIASILSRLFPDASMPKKIKLQQLKGFSEEELKDQAYSYYQERIRPHFIRPAIQQLYNLQAEGYRVGLVSGGYSIYLCYFTEEFHLDFVISSKIAFDDNKICTGRLAGKDCMNHNKVRMLDEFFLERPGESIAVSDSKSDLPLLRYASQGVVISHLTHQKWIDNYHFEELIWG